MTNRPATDRETFSAADEFIWDVSGHTEVHHYITAPVLRLLRSHGATEVLDLGCGNGAFTAQLAREGYRMTGLDFSESGITLAKKNYPEAEFAQHDAQDPLPAGHTGKYDAVVSIEVIEHLLLPRKLVENAVTALKPGGLFILSTPYHGYWKNLFLALTNKFDNHWHPLRDYGHIKFFSRKTITELFKIYSFRNISFETVGRIRPLARSMIISGVKGE